MSGGVSGTRLGATLTLVLLAAAASAGTQQLEPRAYAANPSGANFVVLAFGRTTGSVFVDPSLPLTDVQARSNGVTALYGRSFGVLGRSASVGLAVPYLWGTVQGEVFEEFRSVRRSSLTLAWPIGRQHSVKLAWATGAITRIGGDFQTLAAAWQYLWF